MPTESATPVATGEEILTVSGLNRLARQALESRFPLLWVSGEISNLRRPASGHIYFALKDEEAQVDCVMFRGRAQLIPFSVQDGMRVEARALVTIYEARGGFQLNVEALRHSGIGTLFEAFVRLRRKLEGEGLFAPQHKEPLPRFPRRIGVVTSLQAAALRDVLASLARRAPHVATVIYPTLVQGEGAAASISEAIAQASGRGECDVLIVARGGGSLEDMQAFNEEIVARAIDACTMPVITGIGHETDTTIADLVADCRAATPTAAAELASAGFFEAQSTLLRLATTLRVGMQRRLQEHMQRVDLLARRLIHPGERLGRLRAETAHLATRLGAGLRLRIGNNSTAVQRLEVRLHAGKPDLRQARKDLEFQTARMRAAVANVASLRKSRLDSLENNLSHLSPQAVLQRGYSLVRTQDGSIVRISSQLAPGDTLHLTFGTGGADAHVLRTKVD